MKPLLQLFLNGVMHANSAPRTATHDTHLSPEAELMVDQAERELEDVVGCLAPERQAAAAAYDLGWLADAGYTLRGEDGDLKCYEILDMEY